MRIFLIGNGFDIAHGLPTWYWDFRTYLERMYPEFLAQFEEHYQIYPGMSEEEKKSLLWKSFETNLANIDEESIITMGTGIELDLESGDVGIEDTLYLYFTEEYKYINFLAKYLKQWIRTIRIRDCLPRTSAIYNHNQDFFITFNYTSTLENVYRISADNILHIHGSLRNYTLDPVIGHGNFDRIKKIDATIKETEMVFDEKWKSICRVVKNYYTATLKDVSKYGIALSALSGKEFSEIVTVGLSIDGVDLPYFASIDSLTGKCLPWKVYCYREGEGLQKKSNLLSQGITKDRIEIKKSSDFFDLQNDSDAKEYAVKLKYNF